MKITIKQYPRLKRNIISCTFILTLFLFIVTDLIGQSQYNNLNPVQYIKPTPLELDINKDGNIDIKLFTTVEHIPDEGQEITYKIETSESLSVALTNDSASVFYRNDIIGSENIWSDNINVPFQYVFKDWYYGNAEITIGNWSNLPNVPLSAQFYNAYLGIKIIIDDQAHYGWVRLNFDLEIGAYVLDYAYNEIPNEEFSAGKGMPTGAISVAAEGFKYYDNMSKFIVSFVNEEREDVISSYRIIIAKAEDTTCNNLEVMNNIPSGQYQFFNNYPDDNEFLREMYLFEQTRDKDGDQIERFRPYKVYVLSIAESGEPSENIISSPSETFTLQNYTQAAEIVSSIDNGNTNTPEDIYVTFSNVEDKIFVDEFRVFVCNINNDLTLDEAINLDDNRYTSIRSLSDDISLSLKENQLDVDGNEIKSDVFYKTYILTVPDSLYSQDYKLSEPSYKFRLKSPNTYYAGSKTEENVFAYPADSLHLEYPYWHGPGGGHTSGNVNIDINNDGLDDFNFIGHFYHSHTSSSNYLGIYSLRNNQVLTSDQPDQENWILPLFEGNEISDEYSWSTDTAVLLDSYYSARTYENWSYGLFNQQQYSYYVGLKLNDYENPQFAWIKFDFKRYVEYGYQTKNIGIDELLNETIHISPNPASDYFFINIDNNNIINNRLCIYNSSGKIVEEISIRNQSNKISTINYPKGIYLLIVKNNGEIIKTEKLIVN